MQYIERWNSGPPVAPEGFLDEDIGQGLPGKYFVYIGPIFTPDRSLAASTIDFVLSDDPIKGMDDLAKSYGGKYRYLRPLNNDDKPKITNIQLVERNNVLDGCTTNINSGRGGRYLYLCWTLDKQGKL